MKVKLHLLILLFSSFLLAGACSNSSSKKETPTQNMPSNVIELPGIPSEKIVELWEKCELVDYIFHDLPFSLNQSEKPAIRANLNFIGTDPVGKVNLDCKPMGREFFQIGGEIVLEADVYYSPGCYFYVFVDGNTPIYANTISEAGMNFYKQITTQVKVGN